MMMMMMMMRVGWIQRFVPSPPVWTHSSCTSPALSPAYVRSGCQRICPSSSFSSSASPQRSPPPGDGKFGGQDLQNSSMGLIERYKKTLKQHGKVMIPVHLLTSCMWFSGCYFAAKNGLTLTPLFEHIRIPEEIVNILENSQGGKLLTAFTMYKIATPARFMLTLCVTTLSVKYLRKHGYMPPPPLVPPVRKYLKEKMKNTKGQVSERMKETKYKLKEKLIKWAS